MNAQGEEETGPEKFSHLPKVTQEILESEFEQSSLLDQVVYVSFSEGGQEEGRPGVPQAGWTESTLTRTQYRGHTGPFLEGRGSVSQCHPGPHGSAKGLA